MSERLHIRQLTLADLPMLGDIDRSERLRIRYSIVDGQLTSHETDVHVPEWNPIGNGDHSVGSLIQFAKPVMARGGDFLGVLVADRLAGLAIVEATFEARAAWLALLHVDRLHRRRGVASALWGASVDRARTAGASSLYVSATPSDSAVGFYLSRGCRLATASEVNDKLYDLEPDDIHLTCDI